MRTLRKPQTSYWKPFPPAGPLTSLPPANHRTNSPSTAMPAPAVPRPPATDIPQGDMDEHWTAVTANLADMYFPNEG